VKNGAGGSAISLLSLNYDMDGAVCARDLAGGNSSAAQRVRTGIDEIRRNGDLRGRPAIIVHGRSDTLIPVGFTSRPYFGLNNLAEGRKSQLSYIEVTNAQHFDAFLGFAGFAENYVPLHRYFIQAMDMMYAHLTSGQKLPESQVVRTVPRGKTGALVNPITTANVPPIGMTARAADRITVSNGSVFVPD
jgi:hydroxybutyrate-dimer hydrolase